MQCSATLVKLVRYRLKKLLLDFAIGEPDTLP